MLKKDLKNWRGILKIDEFSVLNEKKEIIYQEKNIHNILHQEGELLILSVLFTGSAAPSSYYIGLDNRPTLAFTNTLSSLSNEPTSYGYSRQQILPAEFNINFTSGSNYQVTGPVINFSATTNQWGPVQNLFLTNVSSGNGGTLISSARLAESITVIPPNIVSLKFSFALSNC
jgi:hypothetical protein